MWFSMVTAIAHLSMLEHCWQVFKKEKCPNLEFILKSNSNLFLTTNFMHTIEGDEFETNDFTRLVDGILLFNNGQVLLLSDYESEHIVKVFHEQFLNGECQIPKKSLDIATVLLNKECNRKKIRNVVEQRGMFHNWAMSDIERICKIPMGKILQVVK